MQINEFNIKDLGENSKRSVLRKENKPGTAKYFMLSLTYGAKC